MADPLYDYCSRPVKVSDFRMQMLESYAQFEISEMNGECADSHLCEIMGTDQETLEELKSVCSFERLRLSGVFSNLEAVEPDRVMDQVPLESIRKAKEATFSLRLNYANLEPLVEASKPDQVNQEDRVRPDELVLLVAINHPRKKGKMQEFLVLGSQKLTTLRDAIFCFLDHVIPGDHSDNLDLSLSARTRDICRSAFFFVEGVFYNDLRDPLARDYSESIIDWVKSKDRWKSLGLYTKSSMEDTSFEDLTLRVGYPYLYCHLGNCEHLLYFRDLRLIHPTDPQDRRLYPFVVFKGRTKRQRCNVCEVHTAVWMTKNDSLAVQDPAFFCHNCFDLLHYDSEGKKMVDFEAYPFYGYHDVDLRGQEK